MSDNNCWDHNEYMRDITTQDGCTPLYLASLKGCVAVVRLLIARKADVDICNMVCLFSLPVDTVYYFYIYRVN